MITIDQWSADEERQDKLRALINDPVMQEALYLVKQACIPAARQVDNPEHLVTLYALDHARAGGWHAALNLLEKLQKREIKAPAVPPKPWKHKTKEQ